MLTRDMLVKQMVDEYRANGQQSAIKLFDKFIKQYEISQHGIKVMISEFREAIQ